MIPVIFVAPHLSDNASRMVEAIGALPGVQLGVISMDRVDHANDRTRGAIAQHWRIDDVLDVEQLRGAVQQVAARIGGVKRLFGAYEQLQVPLAQSSGFASIYKNDGEISNRGLEFGLNTVNLEKEDLRWNTSFNIATNVSRIEKLSIPIDASYSVQRLAQGQPYHAFYVYKQLYVDPQTGDAVYEDVNKDGKITAADRQFIGSALPKFFGGMNNTLTYKGFDLSVFVNFSSGNLVFNNNRFFHESGGTRDDRRAINKNQLNRWQKPGDITDVPRITTIGNNYNLSPTSRFLEDGSFIRLNSIVLGYAIPKTILQKVGITSARVFYNGSNLALFNKYQGPDPEVNVTSSPTVQGYGLGTPPQPRTAQFGINLTL